MDLILNNPFRVLGLPLNATTRQITKRVDDLSMYCEMNKAKSYDSDFTFLSNINRTIQSVEFAASQLELIESKLFHSIFWFWNNNSVDDLVFDLLSEGNVQKARDILEKALTNKKKFSKQHLSTSRNLALLNVISSHSDGSLDHEDFLSAAKTLINNLDKNSFEDYTSAVNCSSNKNTLEEIQKLMVDEIYKTISQAGNIHNVPYQKAFLLACKDINDVIFKYSRNKVVSVPISLIDTLVQESQSIETENGATIIKAAEHLYEKASELLIPLRDILTAKDLQYRALSDKVAGQLLIFSTRYYNLEHKQIDGASCLDQSEKITSWASTFAKGDHIKAKIRDDQATINELRQQNKNNEILADWMQILTGLPDPNSLTKSVLDSIPRKLKTFVLVAKRTLSALPTTSSEEALLVSETTVRVVLSLSIEYANDTGKREAIVEILDDIKLLQMNSDTRAWFEKNLNILKANMANSQNAGCFIATLVYGDSEAEQVLALRRFRDDQLQSNALGRVFVRVYYAVSPRAVTFLKKRIGLQRVIRKLLDGFIAVRRKK